MDIFFEDVPILHSRFQEFYKLKSMEKFDDLIFKEKLRLIDKGIEISEEDFNQPIQEFNICDEGGVYRFYVILRECFRV